MSLRLSRNMCLWKLTLYISISIHLSLHLPISVSLSPLFLSLSPSFSLSISLSLSLSFPFFISLSCSFSLSLSFALSPLSPSLPLYRPRRLSVRNGGRATESPDANHRMAQSGAGDPEGRYAASCHTSCALPDSSVPFDPLNQSMPQPRYAHT